MNETNARGDVIRVDGRPQRVNGFACDPKVQCGSKKKFTAKKRAKLFIRRMRTNEGRATLSAYRCPHCGFFHIGRFIAGGKR